MTKLYSGNAYFETLTQMLREKLLTTFFQQIDGMLSCWARVYVSETIQEIYVVLCLCTTNIINARMCAKQDRPQKQT
jgi:hypothetical protein